MFYKTRKGLLICLYIALVVVAGCGSEPDENCTPTDGAVIERVTEEGKEFISVFNNGSISRSYINPVGQTALFNFEELENSLVNDVAFIECGNDFIVKEYNFEQFRTSADFGQFYFEIYVRKGFTRQLSNFFFPEDVEDCISEIFQINFYENQTGFQSEARVETIQNTCFSSNSLDNFIFMNEVTLNDVTFQNVYTNEDQMFVDTQTKLYYSIEKGLVGFTDSNSIDWHLRE